jgi:hypothetical protein
MNANLLKLKLRLIVAILRKFKFQMQILYTYDKTDKVFSSNFSYFNSSWPCFIVSSIKFRVLKLIYVLCRIPRV